MEALDLSKARFTEIDSSLVLDNEYGNCGYGTIVPLGQPEPSDDIIAVSADALDTMSPRTGTNADGTSDGNGIQGLFEQKFFQNEFERLRKNITDGTPPPPLDDGQRVGVGMFQLPRDPGLREQCKRIVDDVLKQYGYQNALWRDVPTTNDPKIVEKARESAPHFGQILIPQENEKVSDPYKFEMDLKKIQKVIQKKIEEAELVGKEPDNFYTHGISHYDVTYKGKFKAKELILFFDDLRNPALRFFATILHGRFSTNTQPENKRAQPFPCFAHNGEINNINKLIQAWPETFAILRPLIAKSIGHLLDEEAWESLERLDLDGSDSAILGEMMDVMRMAGFSPVAVEALTFQPVLENRPDQDPEFVEIFQKIRSVFPAAEGPVGGIVHGIAPDGNMYFLTASDKLTLRPLASEIDLHPKLGRTFVSMSDRGAVHVDRKNEVEAAYNTRNGYRIGVNFTKGEVLYGEALMNMVASEVRELLSEHAIPTPFQTPDDFEVTYYLQENPALFYHALTIAGVTSESVHDGIDKTIIDGREPVIAMGRTHEGFLTYGGETNFSNAKEQKFSQVTNPATDAKTEELFCDPTIRVAGKAFKNGPVIDSTKYQAFQKHLKEKGLVAEFDITLDPEGGETLEQMIKRVQETALTAAREGKHIFLHDRGIIQGRVDGSVLLAADKITSFLTQNKAIGTSVNVSFANMQSQHVPAFLADSGVSLINPWGAEEIIEHNHKKTRKNTNPNKQPDDPDELPYYDGLTLEECKKRFYAATNASLMKIASQQGIQSAEAFRGSRNFHYKDLDQNFMNFLGAGNSRLGGISIEGYEERLRQQHERASAASLGPDTRNRYRASIDGSARQHRVTPEQNALLQEALDTGLQNKEAGRVLFNEYMNMVNDHNDRVQSQLRDYMGPSDKVRPIEIEKVSHWRLLGERLRTMHASRGAINRAAHQTLSIAMNRIRKATESLINLGHLTASKFRGPQSGSGEGGEENNRRGTEAASAIKQIASGRFGVTAAYLTDPSTVSFCIKITQGAKPGLGGQLPGAKVEIDIATLRNSEVHTELISPPPHHDIYSIEDLEQLIYELKKINPNAPVSVKLTAQPGIGTIACGVAKAGADIIEVMGPDGGTAASPDNSVKNAGSPLEEGVAEVQQALVRNNLRDRVQIHAGGGIRTGRDIARLILLGADTFELGTEAMFSEGCIYLKTCNVKCSAGLITDDTNFRGTPERTMLWTEYLLENTREEFAKYGISDPQDYVGCVDLLQQDSTNHGTDLTRVLDTSHIKPDKALRFTQERGFRNNPKERDDYISPDQEIIAKLETLNDEVLIEKFSSTRPRDPDNPDFEFHVNNTHRAIGAELTYYLYSRFGPEQLEKEEFQIRAKFHGIPGASFGVFLGPCILLDAVDGTANYTAKGLSGGTVLTPYAGDVIAYGATSGTVVFSNGEQIDSFTGARTAIRNSGATIVSISDPSEHNDVVGDSTAEYMTKGTVYIPEVKSAFNLCSAHSGGVVIAYDPRNTFNKHTHPKAHQNARRLETEEEKLYVRMLIETANTHKPSNFAASMLDKWEDAAQNHIVIDPSGKFKEQAEQWYVEKYLPQQAMFAATAVQNGSALAMPAVH